MVRYLEEAPASRWQKVKLGGDERQEHLYIKKKRIYFRDFKWTNHAPEENIDWLGTGVYFNDEYLIQMRGDKYRVWKFKKEYKGSRYL